jgi:hypothetical protein
MRAVLEAAPDLLAHIRTLVDPLKATQYDREPTSGGAGRMAPPPVPVELLDAGDEIMTILWRGSRAALRGEIPPWRVVVPPGMGGAEIHGWSRMLVRSILADFDQFAASSMFGAFVEAVIGEPADKDGWTIAKALRRWGLREKPWWAVQPCPIASCGLRSVRVTPPAVPGDATGYRCEGCGWEAGEADLDICAAVFTKSEGRAA